MEGIEVANREDLEALWKLPERVAQLVGEEGWFDRSIKRFRQNLEPLVPRWEGSR